MQFLAPAAYCFVCCGESSVFDGLGGEQPSEGAVDVCHQVRPSQFCPICLPFSCFVFLFSFCFSHSPSSVSVRALEIAPFLLGEGCFELESLLEMLRTVAVSPSRPRGGRFTDKRRGEIGETGFVGGLLSQVYFHFLPPAQVESDRVGIGSRAVTTRTACSKVPYLSFQWKWKGRDSQPTLHYIVTNSSLSFFRLRRQFGASECSKRERSFRVATEAFLGWSWGRGDSGEEWAERGYPSATLFYVTLWCEEGFSHEFGSGGG